MSFNALGASQCVIALSEMTGAAKRLRENIELWMTERRLNQRELAERAHISQGFLSQILGGRRDLPTRTVQAIADALRVPIERLWEPKGGIKRLLEKKADIDPGLRARFEELNSDGRDRLLEQAELLSHSEKYRLREDEKKRYVNQA